MACRSVLQIRNGQSTSGASNEVGVAHHVAGMLESGGGVEQGLKLRIVGGILSEPDGVGSHVRPPSRLSQYEAIRHREERQRLQPELRWSWDSSVFPPFVDEQKIRKILLAVKTPADPAERLSNLPYFNPPSFRKTLALLGGKTCKSPEEYKGREIPER